jgi:hypothetical protein
MHTNPQEKLRSICIALPEVLPRWLKGMRAAFAPFVRSALAARSRRLAEKCQELFVGKVGADIAIEQGKATARAGQSNVLPFSNTPLAHRIADGASEFFVEVLGEPGQHVRSAMTAADPPLGRCLEIELFAEVFEPGAA